MQSSQPYKIVWHRLKVPVLFHSIKQVTFYKSNFLAFIKFVLQNLIWSMFKPPRKSWFGIFFALLIGCSNDTGSIPSPQTKAIDRQGPESTQPEVKAEQETTVAGTATYAADNTIGAEQLGIPLYPSAERLKSGTWDIRNPGDGSAALTALQLRSDDPLATVAAFYRQKLQNAQFIEINRASGKRVSITVSLPDQTTTSAVLYEDGTGTRIEITKLGESSATVKQ